MATSKHDQIHDKWENIYLDQGGSLTLEQRDKAFTEAMEALKQLELQVALTVKIEEMYDAFAITIGKKRFYFDQEDDKKALVKVFKALGHEAKYEEVY